MTPWDRITAWVRNALILSGVGVLAFFGETGSDGGLVKTMWADIWAATKTASPLGAMILMLLLIDAVKERREAQKQCNERTIDFVQATNRQTAAMEDQTGVLKAVLRRAERKRR